MCVNTWSLNADIVWIGFRIYETRGIAGGGEPRRMGKGLYLSFISSISSLHLILQDVQISTAHARTEAIIQSRSLPPPATSVRQFVTVMRNVKNNIFSCIE